jgi:hypothetical protein
MLEPLYPKEDSQMDDLALKIQKIKEAFIKYEESEGCGCCADYRDHDDAHTELKLLLDIDT